MPQVSPSVITSSPHETIEDIFKPYLLYHLQRTNTPYYEHSNFIVSARDLKQSVEEIIRVMQEEVTDFDVEFWSDPKNYKVDIIGTSNTRLRVVLAVYKNG